MRLFYALLWISVPELKGFSSGIIDSMGFLKKFVMVFRMVISWESGFGGDGSLLVAFISFLHISVYLGHRYLCRSKCFILYATS